MAEFDPEAELVSVLAICTYLVCENGGSEVVVLAPPDTVVMCGPCKHATEVLNLDPAD